MYKNKAAYNQVIVMVTFILPLLLLNYQLSAREKEKTVRKHEFRALLGAGIITPPEINEVGGPNLQRKFSWTCETGIGYGHQLYKNLSAVVSLGANVYSYKYAADVVIDGPLLAHQAFAIRRTERFYCFYASLTLSQRFILAQKLFAAEAGIKFTETPSLLLGHGQAVQDSLGGYGKTFFDSEALFEGEILDMYFLKFGTPLFKNTSKFSANIVFNYCPAPLGNGNFYFANTTKNSFGTFKVRGSSMGVELRYTF